MEVQGEYVTQSMIDREIAYTRYISTEISTQHLYNIYTEYLLSVTITYDSIPGWGRCYSRAGHQHVLEDVTVNGDSCYKCAKIQVSGVILLYLTHY